MTGLMDVDQDHDAAVRSRPVVGGRRRRAEAGKSPTTSGDHHTQSSEGAADSRTPSAKETPAERRRAAVNSAGLEHDARQVNYASNIGDGYNYDSTSIRLQFDRATTVRRPTLLVSPGALGELVTWGSGASKTTIIME